LLDILANACPGTVGTGFINPASTISRPALNVLGHVDKCPSALRALAGATQRGVPVDNAVRGNRGAVELLDLGGVARRPRSGSLLEPPGLGIDVLTPYAASPAPGAGDWLGGPAQVGDDPAGGATGHTLPRPVRRVCSILAVGCLVRHAAMRLAFRA
jgi:hypothetical protein